MNPVQTALSGTVSSMMDDGKKAPVLATPVTSIAPSMPSLASPSDSADFTRIFGSGTQGETRVQGRVLEDVLP